MSPNIDNNPQTLGKCFKRITNVTPEDSSGVLFLNNIHL